MMVPHAGLQYSGRIAGQVFSTSAHPGLVIIDTRGILGTDA